MPNVDIPNLVSTQVRRTAMTLDRKMDAEMTTTRLTYRQMLVLVAIHQTPGTAQRHIITETGVDRTSVSGIIEFLDRAKLITLAESGTDRRIKELKCTEEGKKRAKSGADILLRLDGELRRELHGLDHSQFAEALNRLGALKHEREEAGRTQETPRGVVMRRTASVTSKSKRLARAG